MRRIFSLIAVIILAILVVLIIQRRPESPNQGPVELTDSSVVSTTSGSAITTDRTVATTSTSAGEPEETTDTTEVRSIDTAPEPDPESKLTAEIVITQVVFGDGGYVVITNVGGAPGSIGGYALCQRPSYFTLPDIELAPFESVWVAAGDGTALTATSAVAVIPAFGSLSSFNQDDGEMGLYTSPDFGSADAMVSYVEWGSSGHGRSSVAVEAGLWATDAFIEIPDDAFGVQSTDLVPDAPEDWVAALGG